VLRGDAVEQGEVAARALRDGARGVYVCGGETTVRLPDTPGRGGRNQQLALAAACVLEGAAGLLLACASDGVDGKSPDAGALVDGQTTARIRQAGLSPQQALLRADSNRTLAAAGDVIHIGPTGTKVAEHVIAWKP